MELTRVFTDERAVSPVIGVILMVAITVILAAVVGAFVLGLGDATDSAPQAQFSFEFNGSTGLNITHEGGNAIEADTLNVTSSVSIGISSDGSTYGDPNGVGALDDDDPTSAGLVETGAFASGTTIDAGTTIYVATSETFAGKTVRVIWSSPNADKTATLARWDD